MVAKAGTANEAITKTIEFDPDIILMDIAMPGMCCFEATRRIRRLRPQARVVFLSASTQDSHIDQALQVEARGYLTKLEPPVTIVQAILDVASGGAYFSEEVQARINGRRGQ